MESELALAKATLAAAQSGDDATVLTRAVRRLTGLYHAEGNSEEAVRCVGTQLPVARSRRIKPLEASLLMILAESHLATLHAAAALDNAEDAQSIFLHLGDRAGESEAMVTTVIAFLLLGEFQQALDTAKANTKGNAIDALAAAKRRRGEMQTPDWWINEGALNAVVQAYIAVNDFEGALVEVQQTLGELRRVNDRTAVLRRLYLAASLQLHLELYSQAVESARAVLNADEMKTCGHHAKSHLERIVAQSRDKVDALSEHTISNVPVNPRRTSNFCDAMAEELSVAFDHQDSRHRLRKFMPQDVSCPPSPVQTVVRLRSFTVLPEGGRHGDVEWAQTLGKVTLAYIFDDPRSADDIKVSASSWQLHVTVSGKVFSALSGDLHNDVMVRGSWWNLEQEDWGKRRQLLVVQLSKKKSGAWSKLWHHGALNPRKMKAFPWSEAMYWEQAAPEEVEARKLSPLPRGQQLSEDNCIVSYALPPGPARMFVPRSPQFLFSPDDFVVGAEVRQDAAMVTVTVFFDEYAGEYVEQQISLEDLFRADVWESGFYIYLRGDAVNPILWAEFEGVVVPERTTWKIALAERGAEYMPAVVMKLAKRDVGRWPEVCSCVVQHRCMVKNIDEYDEMIAEMERRSNTSKGGDVGDVGTNEMSRISTEELRRRLEVWQEERYELMPGAILLARGGFDLDGPDFASWLEEYSKNILLRTSHLAPAKQLEIMRSVIQQAQVDAGVSTTYVSC